MLNVMQMHRDEVEKIDPACPPELRDAARSIRLMADYLEQHPEALIRGKEEGS